ncbi:MAG: DUF1579 domain-containing protein [Lacipirellulaceae bacterium]
MRFAAKSMVMALVGLVATSSVWAQMPQPGEQHVNMAREAGVWDAEVKMWMSPDAPPMPSKGIETNTMLGDFWMLSDFEMDMGGMKYKGRGQYGYDPKKKKYVGTWVDNMSPYLSTMEGDYDVETHTLTMVSTGINMMTGKEQKSKMVSKYIDENTKHFEIHHAVEGEEGKWWKAMEISYKKRAKSDAVLK